MDNAQTTTSMGAGLVTSVFLHAAVAVVLWQHGDALLSGSRADASGVVIPLTPPPVQATPDDPESDPVRLGIAEGIAETPTWLGYKDPTRHAATPATIDQAAFTIATGPINDGIVGGETEAPAQGEGERTIPPEPLQSAAVPTPSTPSPEDLPPPMADPANVEPTGQSARPIVDSGSAAATYPVPQSTPITEQSDSDEALSIVPGQTPEAHPLEKHDSPGTNAKKDAISDEQDRPAAQTQDDEPPRDQEDRSSERDLRTSPAPDFSRPGTPDSQTAPAVSPPQPPSAPPARRGISTSIGARPGTSGRPGERTDQHSDATSTLREVIDVVPGRPAAARGLKIRTTPPRWSVTTTLVRAVRNPIVSITFGRSGKVIRAGFLRGYNAGSPDVDGPLLDAIHEWRAEGELLRTIPDGPDAGITVTMRITLRGV